MPLLLLVGATLLPSPNCPGASGVEVKTNYYKVYGIDRTRIRYSIERNRPWKRNSDAHTRWDVTWKYTSAPQSGLWSLQSFHAQSTVVITLPQYIPPKNVDPRVTHRWAKFIAALQTHEDQHKKDALAAAAEIERAVQSVKPAPSNAALKASLQRVVSAVVADYQRKQSAYDKKTRHGATQGATF